MSRERDRERTGRHRSRFSLASVTNVFDAVKERVRSTSPHHAHGHEHGHGYHAHSRETSLDRVEEEAENRGRGRERKEKSAFGLLSEKLLGADGEGKDKQASGDGWKEFRKGK